MIELLAVLGASAVIAHLVAPPALRRVPGRPPPPTHAASLTQAAAALVARATSTLDRLHPAGRIALRDAQLPDALDRLASALRAGHALGPALGEVAGPLPDPLGAELRRLTDALAHGAPIAAAATAWAQRPHASSDVRLVAAALALGADSGGEVARAIDRVAATLRERRELRGEVRSLATQARASAGVLALAPVAFTAFVATIEPGAAAFLVATPIGLGCLVLGTVLEALGVVWMARIARSAA